jgi:hypothetical protein
MAIALILDIAMYIEECLLFFEETGGASLY